MINLKLSDISAADRIGNILCNGERANMWLQEMCTCGHIYKNYVYTRADITESP